jgi:hypothetical protein
MRSDCSPAASGEAVRESTRRPVTETRSTETAERSGTRKRSVNDERAGFGNGARSAMPETAGAGAGTPTTPPVRLRNTENEEVLTVLPSLPDVRTSRWPSPS